MSAVKTIYTSMQDIQSMSITLLGLLNAIGTNLNVEPTGNPTNIAMVINGKVLSRNIIREVSESMLGMNMAGLWREEDKEILKKKLAIIDKQIHE